MISYRTLFLIVVGLLGLTYVLYRVNDRVPEPAPATASWSDGYGSGVVLSVSVENIAHDCKLGKKFLEVMKQSDVTVPPPVQGPNSVPAYINISMLLPDGRTAVDTYYLTYWQDEFELRPVSCEVSK